MSLNVNAAMDALGGALGTLTGVNVFDFAPDSLTPPAVVVGLPDQILFDAARARESDRATFKVYVFVGAPDDQSARDALAGYMSGAGTTTDSVKAAVDALGAHVRVMSCVTRRITIGSQDLLAAVFDVDYIA